VTVAQITRDRNPVGAARAASDRRATRLRLALQLSCLAGVVWWLVVPQLRRSSTSLHLLADVDNVWVPLAIAAELASLTVFALATRTLIRVETRPKLHHVLRIDLSTIAVSHCVPAGGAAGSALGWRLLTQAGVPPEEAGFIKVVQGVGSAVVLQIMMFAAVLYALPTYGLHSWAVYPAAVDAGLLAGVGGGLLAARHPWVRRRAAGAMRRALRVPSVARHRIGVLRLLGTLEGHAHAAIADRGRMYAATAWTAANWGFDLLALWASLHAYGASIPADGVVLAFGLASMIAWLPVTPSGLGVTEGVMIPLLVVFGSTSSAAVLGVLTWRLMSFWLPIPLGALAYGSLRLGSGRRLVAARKDTVSPASTMTGRTHQAAAPVQ
jgi:uncharacterized protein (TIRG00374 family)